MSTTGETAPEVIHPSPIVLGSSGIEFSPALSNIAKALILAQGNMSEIHKSSTNPHFRSKYADLPTCVEAVQPALQAAGIALLQAATSNADASVVFVETMFLHESGEWVRSRLGLRPVKTDPQGAGSAITYGRRYTLLAMCGVAPEEDDDGNAASRRRAEPQEHVSAARMEKPTAAPAPRSTAQETPANGNPKQSLDSPGSITETSAKKLYEWLSLLSADQTFTLTTEMALWKEATNGRVSEPTLSLLSENEGRRLGKLLKPKVEAAARSIEIDRNPAMAEEAELPL